MKLLLTNHEDTDVLVLSAWRCVLIPLEASSSGVACALPAEVIDVIAGAEQFISEDFRVELGTGVGDFGAPSGEYGQVVFAILQK